MSAFYASSASARSSASSASSAPVGAGDGFADSRPAQPSGWTTASLGHAPDTSPAELEQLGDHLDGCRRRGRWFVWRCRAEAVGRFAAARTVTTVAVVLVLAGVALLLG